MKTIIDLHMHSHYSRATSKQLTPFGIVRAAALKGVDVIATGDITHPKWLDEIERDCIEDGSGFLTLRPEVIKRDWKEQDPEWMRDSMTKVRLILFGEVSNIYRRDDKSRRVHMLFGVSSLAAARAVNTELQKQGYNITYDGRPIIGMDVRELMKIYLKADSKALVIPAHIWTPWFALFGSKSGFDSVEECFGDMTPHIFAIETGLSSDPAMNVRVSSLNNVLITSHSDAHSTEKVGREATVMDLPERTYTALHTALKNREGVLYTIEFYPEEGKYHMDGHRACNVRLTPKETAKNKGLCPACALPVVVGVLNRVEQLADQTADDRPNAVAAPFKSIVPLPEIIASAFGVKSATSKRVQAEFFRLIAALGNEFYILLDVPLEKIAAVADPLVVEGIRRMRAGTIHIEPGYDGAFGVVEVFSEDERKTLEPQQQNLV